MTLQEILAVTEFPIETVYQGTPIKIEEVSTPEFGHHFKVTITDGHLKGPILMSTDLQSLFLGVFPHTIYGPDSYGRRIKKLEEQMRECMQQKDTDLSVGESDISLSIYDRCLLVAAFDENCSKIESQLKGSDNTYYVYELRKALQSLAKKFELKRSLSSANGPYTLEAKDGTLYQVDLESQNVSRVVDRGTLT